ncbi:hypothetical protein SLINC_6707 [Streptomyces lincolnensis]|uniref:Uncharacterized protein n=1 Tax=Streptomyces lincolnensis TaxID=1915 RepID=A0A1B1MK08_STRLN|nr:hypothetical protein [Streptomyces lincolnensis]ANS68931.1 hypothetical protein SLINC_6707 [Streptomyces lincolnensis]AXG52863.1 hypothetical protein SLCG_1708 [Streptomyces lincolnensis]QMV10527.1 hypothetical protein GJU35_35930 [Streptomyces lincolnensis]
MHGRQALAGVFAGAALVAGVVVSSAGDGGAAPDESSPKTVAANAVDESKWPSRMPERGLAKGLSLPVEKYLVGYTDVVEWQRAQRDLWVSCMARFGFEKFNPPVPGANPPLEFNDANMPRRYGASDATQAAEHGYHLPPEQLDEPPAWEPAAGAEGTVFLGDGPELSGGTYNGVKVPEGGCRGETERQLGHLTQGEDASRVNASSMTESLKQPAVQDAIAGWAACMNDRGHAFDDPYKPAASFDLSTSTASAEEIDVATADVACKGETGLIKVWSAAETAIQNQQIAAKKSSLDAELAQTNTVRTTAQRVISEGSDK